MEKQHLAEVTDSYKQVTANTSLALGPQCSEIIHDNYSHNFSVFLLVLFYGCKLKTRAC